MIEEIPVVDLNDYEIIRPIGEGSYGRVFLIQHKTTLKQYACKETFREYKREDKKQDFNKEVLAYSKAHSPAILTIHGFSLQNFQGFNYPIIISEYMENSSLDKYLNQEDSPQFTLTPQQKYKILLGISLGMKTLHSQRIIHRDLKPGNILLDSDFCPHICDFGISYISDLSASQILMNSQVGTLIYQAPEILSDEPYTNKVDVFSFSLIAYHLISGKEPFILKKKTPFQIQLDITRGKRPDLKYIEDQEMKEFFELAWSEIPDRRPSFDLIVEEILSEKYQNFFNVTDEEIDDYLNLFDYSIRNRFSVSKLLSSFRKKGDADSLFQLACMYDQGEAGLEVDKKQANDCYRQACEKGSSEAMLIYCRKLLKGDGIPENKEEAARIYKKFADNGNTKAMNNYGLMLYYGNGIEMDKELAAEYLKKSADDGNPNAMFIYSKMLYEGDGIEMNKNLAAYYYKSAADQGNSKAMLNYTEMCLNGDGIDVNKKEAIKYYEIFASKGNPKAFLNLGIIFLTGNGIQKNKKKAAVYMKNAAELGEVDAMFNYGVMCFLGDGIKTDKKEGVKYIQMAIDHGNENAQKFYNEKIARKDDDDEKILDDSNDDDIEFANPDLSNFKVAFKRIVCPLYLLVCHSEEIKNLGKENQEDADIYVYDGSLTENKYLHYNPKIHLNKIPGIYDFCFNTFLYKKLKEMEIKYPSIYKGISPNTFILPDEEEQFLNATKEPEYQSIPWVLKNNKKNKNGITLIQKTDDFMIPKYQSIIQPFITPYLIDDHKFDIRVYVMITNIKPFTVFIYNDCFAYFCSEPFNGSPTLGNRDSYAFQKKVENESDFNCIRSARKIVQDIAYNDNSLWNKIKKNSALVVLSIYKSIHEKVKEVCQSNDEEFKEIDDKEKISAFHRFFNLLGIDFLINEDGDPLIIGLNDNPGMIPFNDFDNQAKFELIKNEFKLMAAVIKDSKAQVKNWTKIIPSDDHSVKSVVTDLMKEVDKTKKKRSLHRIPSVTYVADDDE